MARKLKRFLHVGSGGGGREEIVSHKPMFKGGGGASFDAYG